MIEMEERRPWTGFGSLLLIGPGAAGKLSLGLELAPLLNRRFVDLDREFERQVGNISVFIADEGYEQYKLRNAALAEQLATEALVSTLLVTSSGFLTPDNPKAALEVNRNLLKTWYSVCLLPSRDLEQAVRIVVNRQLQRAFRMIEPVRKRSSARAILCMRSWVI